MNMANTMKAFRSEEMRLKKNRRYSKCLNRHSKIKLNRYREIDQYPTWSETSVALQSRRRTFRLLSEDGAEIFGANNKKY
jgi:hypothetical protein